jgi:hypothetical protein
MLLVVRSGTEVPLFGDAVCVWLRPPCSGAVCLVHHYVLFQAALTGQPEYLLAISPILATYSVQTIVPTLLEKRSITLLSILSCAVDLLTRHQLLVTGTQFFISVFRSTGSRPIMSLLQENSFVKVISDPVREESYNGGGDDCKLDKGAARYK